MMSAEKITQGLIRIQILDKSTTDDLLVLLAKNGYKVAIFQDKTAITAEVVNFYFKGEDIE